MANLSSFERIAREDVIKAIGIADDTTVAQIIGTGATVDELAEALAWMASDEPMMNSAGRWRRDGFAGCGYPRRTRDGR